MVARRTAWMAVLLLAARSALGSCASPDDGGPLLADDTVGAGVIVQNLQREPTWSFPGLTACVRENPRDFKVQKVELVEPSGDVTVDGGLYFGDEPRADVKPGPLPDSYTSPGTFDGSQLHVTPCSTAKVRALAVGVQVTSRGHWEAKGVSMAYVADGTAHEVRWDLSIRVCAVGPDEAKECQDRPAREPQRGGPDGASPPVGSTSVSPAPTTGPMG